MATLMLKLKQVSFLNACVNFDRMESGRDFESYEFDECLMLAKNAMRFFQTEGHLWNRMITGEMGEYRQQLANEQKRLMTQWIKKATAVLV